ncbi:MAG: HPr family phosphocarrier protein [Alphaproteobacteria bacterium]|nr:HPr family phosphocarrier protein [Alphaproteobacteria bacterium]
MTADFEKILTITNRRGLHARAAAKFVRTVEQYMADIRVSREDVCVCGSSIMGLLTLAASTGTQIRISAKGDDATEALNALEALVSDRFGEDI